MKTDLRLGDSTEIASRNVCVVSFTPSPTTGLHSHWHECRPVFGESLACASHVRAGGQRIGHRSTFRTVQEQRRAGNLSPENQRRVLVNTQAHHQTRHPSRRASVLIKDSPGLGKTFEVRSANQSCIPAIRPCWRGNSVQRRYACPRFRGRS